MEFKSHFKLEFDIKTNDDNILKILESICEITRKELFKSIPNLENHKNIDIFPTVTKIDD